MLKHLCGLNSLRNDTYHEENQYLNLVDMILNDGKLQKGRNGNTMAIFGSSMVFSLEDNTILFEVDTLKKSRITSDGLQGTFFGNTDKGNLFVLKYDLRDEPILMLKVV